MATLEEMARRKFPFLSEAEKRVLKAAPNGAVVYCSDLGGGDDPAKADGTPEAPDEKWPETRNVRADLIRWLCVDREAREQVDPGGIQIRGARITGDLDLSFTKVLLPLVLRSCRLEEDIHLEWAKMPLLGLDGSWTREISADGLNLEGGLFLRDGFHAEGEVRLPGATIGGDLSATGGTFKNPKREALSADRIKVRGNVSLNDKFVAEGTVRLAGADINGLLEVDETWLDALNLENAHVTGPFFWRYIHKDRHPDFPNKEWRPSLDLANAKVGALVDEKDSWPEKGRLILDGFVYDRIVAGPTYATAPTDARAPIGATARLRWLHLQPDWLGYRPQPYEQLIALLRRVGHDHQVAKVAIAKQQALYDRGDLGWWGKFWNRFRYRVIGHGYKPWWAFGWMAMLVLLGTLVFWSGHSACVGVMVT